MLWQIRTYEFATALRLSKVEFFSTLCCSHKVLKNSTLVFLACAHTMHRHTSKNRLFAAVVIPIGIVV